MVCDNCHGFLPGCDNSDRSKCPGITGVAANLAAITKADGGKLTATMLPPTFARAFPAPALKVISHLVARPKNGSAFDFTGKSGVDILTAVRTSQASKDDAIDHINTLIEDIPDDDAHAAIKLKKLEGNISAIKALSVQVVANAPTSEGPFLYILYRISHVVCSNKSTAQLVHIDVDEDGVTSTSSSRSFLSSLLRPSSEGEVGSLLNAFTLCTYTFGLVDPIILTVFLEESYHSKVRDGTSAVVAFELVLIYLQHLENHSGKYTFADIIGRLGATDTFMAKAIEEARLRYPPRLVFFRTRGGNPQPDDGKKGDKPYTGELKGYSTSSKLGCYAHSTGTPHLCKHVNNKGICLFNHDIEYVAPKSK